MAHPHLPLPRRAFSRLRPTQTPLFYAYFPFIAFLPTAYPNHSSAKCGLSAFAPVTQGYPILSAKKKLTATRPYHCLTVLSSVATFSYNISLKTLQPFIRQMRLTRICPCTAGLHRFFATSRLFYYQNIFSNNFANKRRPGACPCQGRALTAPRPAFYAYFPFTAFLPTAYPNHLSAKYGARHICPHIAGLYTHPQKKTDPIPLDCRVRRINAPLSQ